jgi:hypothetical protein
MCNKNMTIITTNDDPGNNLHSLFYYATHQQQYPDERQLKYFKRECFDAILNLSQGHRLASFSNHPCIVPEIQKFENAGLDELLDRHYTTTLDIIGCAQQCETNVRVYDDNVYYDIHITHTSQEAHIYQNDPGHKWITLFLKPNGTKQAYLLSDTAHLRDDTALI